MRRLAGPLLCALVLPFLAVSSAEAGATYAFYGSNENGATFNRPNVAGGGLSGKITRFSSQPLFLNATGTCKFESVQEGSFDGVIYLYQGAFDPAAPLAHLMAASDNSPRGPGFSEIAGQTLQVNQNYYLVTTSNEAGVTGTFSNFVSCTGATKVLTGDGSLPSNDGRYGELKNGRFRVNATWRNFQGQTGNGTFVPLGSEETGVIWFFNPSNFEVMLKVVDGCGFNNRYWVFFAALTNVEFHITVRDTWANFEHTYDNVLGVSAAAVTDTSTFQTCP
jgi:hypothetical protein